MQTKFSWISAVSAGIFLVAILLFFATPSRQDLSWLFSTYVLAFASYAILLRRGELNFKQLLFVAIIVNAAAILFEPGLTTDHFRFLWDGEVTWLGLNPFDHTPNQLLLDPDFEMTPYLNELYTEMGWLSRMNYTVYPTINQFYFTIATAFTDNIYVNIVVLKLLLAGTQVLGFIYLIKLLEHLGLDKNRAWLLFLNPLWIIEFMGNTHFEGVMVCLLIPALYFLLRFEIYKGSIFFTFATIVKIVPLILLPFFLNYFGRKRAFFFYSFVLVLTILIGFIYIDADNIANFNKSLTLYFNTFEFNSFAIYHLVQIGKVLFGWNIIQLLSKIFSGLIFGWIWLIAIKVRQTDMQGLVRKMALGYLIFLLLSNSAHPWYILPLIFLTTLTEFSFGLIWSFLIFFTYYFYTNFQNHDVVFRAIVIFEYLVLFFTITYELVEEKTLFRFHPKKQDLTSSPS